jgi:hypothetical protein
MKLIRRVKSLVLFSLLCSPMIHWAQVPVANFSFSPNPVCAGQVITITDLSTGTPSAWSYTVGGFGPGGAQVSSAQNPTFALNGQGTFSIILVATNNSGSSAPVVQTVQVLPSPGVNIAPATQTTCIGGGVNSLSITAGGGGPGGNTAGLTYSWSTGATTSVLALPSQNATNVFTCVITGTNGCTSTRMATVNVGTPSASVVSNPAAICPGSTSTITATGTGGGPYTYSWSTSAITRTTTATVAGVITVTITNTLGCVATQSISLSTSTVLTVSALTNNTVICVGNGANLVATGGSSYVWSNGATTPNTNVTPSVNTTYSVIGSIGTCSGSAVISISVNVTPTITINANPTNLCGGHTSTLTASGASSYTWLPGGPVVSSNVVTPTANTTYTVRGSNPGCPTRAATIALVVLPSPTLLVVSSTTNSCAGDEIALAASGANSYSWSTGSSAPIVLVSPTVTTSYTVTGTGINNCQTTSVYTKTVNACTGIAVNGLNSTALFVFPSPADDQFSIEGLGITSLKVISIQGQMMVNQKTDGSSSIKINTTEWASGLYVIQLSGTDGTTVTRRISVKH